MASPPEESLAARRENGEAKSVEGSETCANKYSFLLLTNALRCATIQKNKTAPDRGRGNDQYPMATPASGCGRKAIPPKPCCGCRRSAAGIALNRRGTVTWVHVERYQWQIWEFFRRISLRYRSGRRLITLFTGGISHENKNHGAASGALHPGAYRLLRRRIRRPHRREDAGGSARGAPGSAGRHLPRDCAGAGAAGAVLGLSGVCRPADRAQERRDRRLRRRGADGALRLCGG